LYRKHGCTREYTEQQGYDAALELLRVALRQDGLTLLLAEGAAMTEDSAVAEAMAIPQPSASQSSQSE
jgi:hypothetical protein